MARKITRIIAGILSATIIAALIALPAGANLKGCRECVKASDIARGAVRSGEIKNGTIRKADLSFKAVTRSELIATTAVLVSFSPLAHGQVDGAGNSELSGWMPPTSTSYDAGNGRYVLDYRDLPQGMPLEQIAVVVTPRDATVERSYWDISGDQIQIFFRDGADAPVATDFGLVVVM